MVSVLCPTRERPGLVRRLVESATQLAVQRPEFIFYVDDDDDETTREVHRLSDEGYDVTMVGGPRITMSNMWNVCVDESSHHILMFVDDEAVFVTPRWDERVGEVISSYPDRAVLVHPNDGIHGEGQAAGYFFVDHVWVDIMEQLTPATFTYGYADVWCIEVAMAAHRYVYLRDVIIQNTAPRNQPPDAVHRANQERAERDRPGDEYLRTQHVRERWVRQLRAYIDEFTEGGQR